MKQRIRPLLLLKRRNAAMQRVGPNTWALQNRLMDDTLFGAPKPVQGWTDGANCDGSGDYVVQFNKVIYWGVTSGILGVKFLNTTTLDTGTPVSVAEASGTASILTYTITWGVAAPVVGDVVVYDYEAAPPDGTGAGVYEDEDGERMQSTTMPMTNCTTQEPIATFISEFTTGSAIPTGLSPVGSYIYNRGNTGSEITDFELLVREIPVNAIAMRGQRSVQNLATGLVTEANIPVISGNEYQVTINGGSGDTAVCSDAFTGTLTADGTNRISWNSGTPKTATTATLDIAVTGTLTELLVESVTGQTVQTPSENVDPTTDYGAGVDGFKYFPYENDNSVNGSGVVAEVQGSTIPVPATNKGLEVWESATNIITQSDAIEVLPWAAAWGGEGVVVTVNDTASPDGAQTADKITSDATSVTRGIFYANAVLLANTEYVVSLALKNVDATQTHIILRDKLAGAGGDKEIRIGWTGSVPSTTSSSGVSNIKYKPLTNDWYRVSFVVTTAASVTTHNLAIVPESLTTGVDRNIYVAEVNLTKGGSVSSPITTVGVQVTRNADDLNYDPANYEETGGCLLDFIVTADQLNNFATSPTIVTIAKALFGDYVTAYINDATTVTIDFVTVAGGGASTADFTVAAGNRYKIAFTWDKVSGTIRASMNGAPAFDFTNASADDILLTADAATFEIGKFNDIQIFNGNIIDIRLTKELVSDSILVQASTL